MPEIRSASTSPIGLCVGRSLCVGLSLVALCTACAHGVTGPPGAAAGDPPAGEIAFVTDRTGDLEIFSMTLPGGEVRNLTRSPAKEYNPAWSPDGAWLAFESDRDGNREIYVARADGSEPMNLTRHPARDVAPAFSPDGRRIAFYGQVGEGYAGADLFVVSPDGTDLVNLTRDDEPDWQPEWTPGGEWILFSRGPSDPLELWILRSDGSDRR